MPLSLRSLITSARGARWLALAGFVAAVAALAYVVLPARQAAQPVRVAAANPPLPAAAAAPVLSAIVNRARQANPAAQGAALGATAVDVIVKTNDTLDGIFRRLKLDLSDLASLRGLPGLRAHLDSLRPGESLHLVHREGSLL